MPSTIKSVIPHLHFNGEAARAIELYEKALGAKVLARMTWSELPGGQKVPAADAGKIMHARLQVGEATLLLADATSSGPPGPPGNGSIMLELEDPQEMASRFDALSAGGTVTMAIHDAFWGARFGMLVDAVGVAWMFHCPNPKP